MSNKNLLASIDDWNDTLTKPLNKIENQTGIKEYYKQRRENYSRKNSINSFIDMEDSPTHLPDRSSRRSSPTKVSPTNLSPSIIKSTTKNVNFKVIKVKSPTKPFFLNDLDFSSYKAENSSKENSIMSRAASKESHKECNKYEDNNHNNQKNSNFVFKKSTKESSGFFDGFPLFSRNSSPTKRPFNMFPKPSDEVVSTHNERLD